MGTAHRRHKDAVYEQLARVAKAMSEPEAARAARPAGCQGPRTVEAARRRRRSSASPTHRSTSSCCARPGSSSRQARALRGVCRLAGDDVARFLVSMRGLAEARLAEVPSRACGGCSAAATPRPVDGPELVARVRRGEVIVLDVRPPEEFAPGTSPAPCRSRCRAQGAPRRAAARPHARRVLPRPLLRLRGRRRRAAARHGYAATRMDQGVPSGAAAAGRSRPARSASP
jgi:hypothetical protein